MYIQTTFYSVQDLVKRINSHSDKIRSTMFIGQSGAQGLKQKQQLETVSEFKKGTFNVLVATCVGEEGLDIGKLRICQVFPVFLLHNKL